MQNLPLESAPGCCSGFDFTLEVVVVSLLLPSGWSVDFALDFTLTFVIELMMLSVLIATVVTCDGKLVRTTVGNILSEVDGAFGGLESKRIQEPPPTGNKEVVGTSKNCLFLQQKSKQLNVTLLKEKLRLEILLKEKQLRDAKHLVFKDSVSYIQAGNVTLHDKSPLKLNENAPDTTIEHGASLTPYHVGGVLLAQIQDDKLYKLTDTVTANAPLQGISGASTSVQVSHPNESPLLHMDTVPCTRLRNKCKTLQAN